MERPKLAIITGNDLLRYGGAAKYVIAFSNHLREKIDVTIYSRSEKKDHRITLDKLKNLTESRIIYFSTYTIPKSDASIPLTKSALRMLLDLRHFKLVYNYDDSPFLNLFLLFISKIFKFDIVVGVHNINPLILHVENPRPILKPFMFVYGVFKKSVFLLMPKIRVVNSAEKENFIKNGYSGRIYLIPDFVEVPDQANIASEGTSEFRVLFVGRLSTLHKGIDLLAEIVDKTLSVNSPIFFRIVGSGEEGEGIVKSLTLRHPDNVKWLGFVDEDALTEEYRNSSLFILTSRFEAFGLSLAEAQIHGLPAVAFDCEGPRDIIKFSYQGRLVRKYDTSEFSRVILEYFEEWGGRGPPALLRKKISDIVIAEYNKDVIVEKYLNMFNLEKGSIRLQ